MSRTHKRHAKINRGQLRQAKFKANTLPINCSLPLAGDLITIKLSSPLFPGAKAWLLDAKFEHGLTVCRVRLVRSRVITRLAIEFLESTIAWAKSDLGGEREREPVVYEWSTLTPR